LGIEQVSLYRDVLLIQKTIFVALLAFALVTVSALANATPIPDFDIKAVLDLLQDRQAAMYESLTKQWEDTTDEDKEAIRLSMGVNGMDASHIRSRRFGSRRI
jgi:hypothetical protein